MGRPLHSNVLGQMVAKRSRQAGTHRRLGHAGMSHDKLPPLPPLKQQPTRIVMAHGPPRKKRRTSPS